MVEMEITAFSDSQCYMHKRVGDVTRESLCLSLKVQHFRGSREITQGSTGPSSRRVLGSRSSTTKEDYSTGEVPQVAQRWSGMSPSHSGFTLIFSLIL